MKISEEQVRRVLDAQKAQKKVLEPQVIYDREFKLPEEANLIAEMRDRVLAMPEVREELVTEIKDRIANGEYNVTSEDIVDAMIRRAIADQTG